MKILLTYPPKSLEDGWVGFLPFPENVVCLGSFLKKNGITIRIYHSQPYKISDIAKIVREQKTDILGISCDSSNFDNCFKLAKLAKNINKNICIILGGNHAAFFHKMILEKIPFVDIIVRGEGELTLLEIIRRLENGGKYPDLHRVKGITYKMNGKIIINPDRPFIDNLDSLPPLSYDLIEINKIRLDSSCGVFLIHTGRGCCFSCQYCADAGIWKNVHRLKSSRKILEEIKICQTEYGVRKFFFSEDTFTINKQRIYELCRDIKIKKIKIEWACNTRIDCVDKTLLKNMKEAGCTMVAYGAESLSDTILQLMGKRYSAALACDTLNYTNALKVDARFNLLLGFPGETVATLKETLNNLNRLNEGVFCKATSLFQLHPGSPIYNRMRKIGLITDEKWFSRYKIGDFAHLYYSKSFVKIIQKCINIIKKKFEKQRLLRHYIDV